MSPLYDRVAARCASADIPVTAACVAEIDRYLREERRVEAYRRADMVAAKDRALADFNDALVDLEAKS
jgi:hypothetical protein